MLPRRSVFLVALAACGSDEMVKKQPDAPVGPMIDAPPPTVFKVTCPSTTVPIVTTSDAEFVYTPMTTMIAVGDIVQFMMSSTHNVVPNQLMSDPGLNAPFNAITCLQFTKAGTFNFHCGPHGFQGMVVVQ